MRFIPTRVHGVLDYLMGVVLIASPWLLNFRDADWQAAMYVPMAMGIAVILYSLMTDYELGAFHLIPMAGHLGLDIAGGLFLAASPWIFGFANEVYLPHLILGLAEVGAGVFTSTTPTARHHGDHAPGVHPAH